MVMPAGRPGHPRRQAWRFQSRRCFTPLRAGHFRSENLHQTGVGVGLSGEVHVCMRGPCVQHQLGRQAIQAEDSGHPFGVSGDSRGDSQWCLGSLSRPLQWAPCAAHTRTRTVRWQLPVAPSHTEPWAVRGHSLPARARSSGISAPFLDIVSVLRGKRYLVMAPTALLPRKSHFRPFVLLLRDLLLQLVRPPEK